VKWRNSNDRRASFSAAISLGSPKKNHQGSTGRSIERAPEEGIDYDHWRIDHVYMILPGVGYVADWLKSFAQFPPRQTQASFNLNEIMQKMSTATANANN
jgi:hypothetical protein